MFTAWNGGELKSFLIDITADIFNEADDLAEGELVDKILDSAGQKGTGRWTSIQALKQGVNRSIITAACNARVMSNLLVQRRFMAQKLPHAIKTVADKNFVESVRRSLYVGKIAAIFRAGCIIQADFLNKITDAYKKNPALENLMLDEFFFDKVKTNLPAMRKVVSLAIQSGVPIPALANAVEYVDTFRSPQLGANLIQAQRDCFGAHTYKRIDRDGTFHHVWQRLAND